MNKILERKQNLVKLVMATGVAISCISAPNVFAENIITNGDFETGNAFPWEEPGYWAGGSGSSTINSTEENGFRHCTTIDTAGEFDWGVQLRQTGLKVLAGHPYTVSFDVWSSAPANIQASAVQEAGGFIWLFGADVDVSAPLAGEPQHVTLDFTSFGETENAYFRFVFGGGRVPAGETICFDNIIVDGPEGSGPPPEADPAPPIHVNQNGYLIRSTKRASYALPESAADVLTPRPWRLLRDNTVIAQGATTPHSEDIDEASGDRVHFVDFSHIVSRGSSYTLEIQEGEEIFTSEPFNIDNRSYRQLKYDALAYFYHNRSGIDIEAEVVGEEWARPAGHLSDNAVETLACKTGEGICRTVDAVGGWYDAGDHGKYVVNGGISVWTLLNQYERFNHFGRGRDPFADGKMALPASESNNGKNDLLDEVRWELEWFFKMQIPEGEVNEFAVYHKMHDENWTGIPLAPHNDTQTRYVHPYSTAATLNFAAVGAQCYRTYKRTDKAFANACLQKAKKAYKAAKTLPLAYADYASNGGGAYPDDNVQDEFYWAATELYLATGIKKYADDMAASPLHLTLPLTDIDLMNWFKTNALGMISLATAGAANKHVNQSWVTTAQAEIIKAADNYAQAVNNEGYGVPMIKVEYLWGSNSAIVNNMIALGLATDFTRDKKYAEAMTESADYLFGRNPLGHSYVTGYGTRVETEPHHRFWAKAKDPNYPSPPAGVLAGGPNTALQDPIAQGLLTGCIAMRCFVDHIDAWSLNEITINWNAPFAWVTAYLDEYARYGTRAPRR